MCSFSIAGFAHEATLLAAALQTGNRPEISGVPSVVRSAATQTGVMRKGTSGYVPFRAASLAATHYSWSSGWMAANNLNAISENNGSQGMPGAGFLRHLQAAVYGSGNGIMNAEAPSATVRVFSFERIDVKKVADAVQRQKVINCWPSKSIAHV